MCWFCKVLMKFAARKAIVARALQAASEGVSEVWLTSEDTGHSSCELMVSIQCPLLAR